MADFECLEATVGRLKAMINTKQGQIKTCLEVTKASLENMDVNR
jgi:hypothetical protein